MLKATFQSSWFRNDGKGKGFTYSVNGTPDELAAFIKAQGQYLVTDKNPDGTPKADGKLYFIRREFSIIDGVRIRNKIRPQLDLGITRDGSGVYVDDSRATMKFNADVEERLVDKVAELEAIVAMGGTIQGSKVTPPARKTDAQDKIADPKDLLNELENDAAKGTNIELPDPNAVKETGKVSDMG